jgi:hypothetical protein
MEDGNEFESSIKIRSWIIIIKKKKKKNRKSGSSEILLAYLGPSRRKLHEGDLLLFYILLYIYIYIRSWYTASAVVDGPAGGQIVAGDPKNRASSS